jgi:hypothetical protein
MIDRWDVLDELGNYPPTCYHRYPLIISATPRQDTMCLSARRSWLVTLHVNERTLTITPGWGR